ARRKRRKRSHCSNRTNCDTSVGVRRSGRLVGRTGSETAALVIAEPEVRGAVSTPIILNMVHVRRSHDASRSHPVRKSPPNWPDWTLPHQGHGDTARTV